MDWFLKTAIHISSDIHSCMTSIVYTYISSPNPVELKEFGISCEGNN